ncbi:hypothetical protein FVE85_3235 [Porphyridium purpureum]|uniref:Uncharacterized protein n=1 Tax=Porphyridium purpureum TaxID=35688 RepID=A0A5J4YW89_PORPP|nr:hypothetical protein FVE85_3235 [Porphyridium purpureum]|eukprot:POR6577..scf227_4
MSGKASAPVPPAAGPAAQGRKKKGGGEGARAPAAGAPASTTKAEGPLAGPGELTAQQKKVMVMEVCGIGSGDAVQLLEECNMDEQRAIERHLASASEWSEVRPTKKPLKSDVADDHAVSDKPPRKGKKGVPEVSVSGRDRSGVAHENKQGRGAHQGSSNASNKGSQTKGAVGTSRRNQSSQRSGQVEAKNSTSNAREKKAKASRRPAPGDTSSVSLEVSAEHAPEAPSDLEAPQSQATGLPSTESAPKAWLGNGTGSAPLVADGTATSVPGAPAVRSKGAPASKMNFAAAVARGSLQKQQQEEEEKQRLENQQRQILLLQKQMEQQQAQAKQSKEAAEARSSIVTSTASSLAPDVPTKAGPGPKAGAENSFGDAETQAKFVDASTANAQEKWEASRNDASLVDDAAVSGLNLQFGSFPLGNWSGDASKQEESTGPVHSNPATANAAVAASASITGSTLSSIPTQEVSNQSRPVGAAQVGSDELPTTSQVATPPLANGSRLPQPQQQQQQQQQMPQYASQANPYYQLSQPQYQQQQQQHHSSNPYVKGSGAGAPVNVSPGIVPQAPYNVYQNPYSMMPMHGYASPPGYYGNDSRTPGSQEKAQQTGVPAAGGFMMAPSGYMQYASMYGYAPGPTPYAVPGSHPYAQYTSHQDSYGPYAYGAPTSMAAAANVKLPAGQRPLVPGTAAAGSEEAFPSSKGYSGDHHVPYAGGYGMASAMPGAASLGGTSSKQQQQQQQYVGAGTHDAHVPAAAWQHYQQQQQLQPQSHSYSQAQPLYQPGTSDHSSSNTAAYGESGNMSSNNVGGYPY